jgi:hypothetical protein
MDFGQPSILAGSLGRGRDFDGLAEGLNRDARSRRDMLDDRRLVGRLGCLQNVGHHWPMSLILPRF